LATTGKISADTLNAVSRDLLPRDMYLQVANASLSDFLDKSRAGQ